ncbi:MAG: putative L-lactate dehydrogenase [Acidimicrobiia bacterium]
MTGVAQMLETLRSVVRFEVPSGDRTERRLRRAADVGDLRALARRRLPRGVFDYIDGGAEDELTLAANAAAYRALRLRTTVLTDVGRVDPSVDLFGRRLAFPLLLAPTGFTRIADPAGELAVARAAARAGLPYVLSTLATRSIEEVAAAGGATADHWFQVYMWRDRGLVRAMVERAAAAGYRGLVLTVDTAVFGRRERDVRRGFTLPPTIGWDTILDGALHPGWTWRFLRSEPIRFANVVGVGAGGAAADDLTVDDAVGDGSDPVTLSDYINAQFDPTLSWADLAWLRGIWSGPVLVKGIQSVRDATRAADEGVDGVVVSNHGGRQLDGVPATVEVLPAIADAVRDRTVVICDGGIRRGSDIVKALVLGAHATMAGRAYLYGLGAAGERGVDHVLGLLDAGVRRTLALLGAPSIRALDPSMVVTR